MNPKPIPGYFYDTEKKKYFKILTASQGPNSAYSVDTLKMRKVLEIREKQASILKRESLSGIKPSAILRSTLPGGLLYREYGFTLIDTPRVLAAGLQPYGVFNMEHSRVKSSFKGCKLFDIVNNSYPNTYSNIVAVNYGDDISVTLISSRDTHPTNGKDEQNFASPDAFIEIGERESPFRYKHPNEPSTISFNQHQDRLLCTNLGFGGAGLKIFFYHHPNGSVIPNFVDERISFEEPYDGPMQYFCSVPAPSSPDILFALGTNQGVFSIITRQLSHPTYIIPSGNATLISRVCHKKDIFAVEFLNECPNLLLSGGRPGRLYLSDLRARSTKLLMKHSSSITHIKSVDSNHILVAGLESSLCQYDIRFLKTSEISATSDSDDPIVTNSSISGSSPKKHSTISTQPIITYHGYHNDATTGLGFDLDLESGIIAAAQEVHEGHKPVQLFSLRNGSALHSPCENLGLDGKKSCGNLVRSIRFVQEDDTTIKSLYIGNGNIVQRYPWNERPVMPA